MNDFYDRSFYTCQSTVFQRLFDVPPAHYVSDDFHSRLCHVAQNLFTDAFHGRRDDRHDKPFKEAADHLGEPVATLVVPPHKYGHRRAAHFVAVMGKIRQLWLKNLQFTDFQLRLYQNCLGGCPQIWYHLLAIYYRLKICYSFVDVWRRFEVMNSD